MGRCGRQKLPFPSGPKAALFGAFFPWPIKAERTHMGHSRFDDAGRERAAWNAGKKVGTKRPFTQKQIWAVRFFLDRERRIRDRALFDLAIDSKLRGCDLVKIRTRDVVAGPEIRTRATVIQQKTRRRQRPRSIGKRPRPRGSRPDVPLNGSRFG